jgi:phosphate transport system substrate-binding protein
MRSYISGKKVWRWALLGIGLAAVLALGAAFAACEDDEGDNTTPSATAARTSTPAAGTTSTPQAAELSGSITVKGSDTMVNLASAWAEDFSNENPKVTISVTGGGSGTGIAALINKQTDIADASRPMSDKEKQDAQGNGVTATETRVALDGLSVVVNPSNPVSELSIPQLSDIYSGKITNWKDVGGNDAGIVVLARDTNSGTHVFFKEHVVQYQGDKTLEYGSDVQFMAATQTGFGEVAQNKNAIMYGGLGYVTDEVKPLGIKKDASSPAVHASIATVKSGEYPIARPLFVYTNGEPTGTLKAYIDWILGSEGQKIVEELEFVPLT